MAGVTISKVVKEKSGKYISIEIGASQDCVISHVSITGDFFAFPPEVIDEVEKYLRGKKAAKSLIDSIRLLVSTVEFAGVSREKFLDLLAHVLEEVSRSCEVSARN
ncbi:MAG: hypothetical protein DRO14_06070 [Thermoprotei archaeon]|nr:MAG: hypothetical protein DRO14_06070 [Thermoprotei archaeon]